MSNNKEEKKEVTEKKNEPLFILLILMIIISIVWTVSGFLVHNFFTEWAERGQFGDMFGAVNSLFSGLAFAGVVYTILLQRKELALQRNEISKSTKELEGQKNLMDLQKFENKFFQLINLHHDIIGSTGHGRGIFQTLATAMYNALPKQNITLTLLNETYFELYNKNKTELGHYFRNLYHIVKFVDSTPELMDFETRYSYIRILRAQLSTYEIVLLSYNGLSKHGKGFMELIEKYKLLKNIDFQDQYLIERALLFEQYPHVLEAFNEQAIL